jgi:alkylation response protein AidB-like acyl-CoA dehydrogenase
MTYVAPLDVPEGVKGISLFLVPKYLLNADGSLGARNDVQCVSIEHKLGIKASPTVMLQPADIAASASSSDFGAASWLGEPCQQGTRLAFDEQAFGAEIDFLQLDAIGASATDAGVGSAAACHKHFRHGR